MTEPSVLESQTVLEGLTYAQVAEWPALNTKRPQLLGTRRHTGYISRRAAVISEDRGEEIEGGTAVTLRVFVYLRVCVFMYLCICVFVYLSAIWEAGGEETGGGSVP